MWSIGVLIVLPILILLALGLVVFIAKVWNLRYSWGRKRDRIPSLLGLGFLIPLLIVMAVAYYPYQKDYHYWSERTGTVAEVSNRLLDSGKGMKQKFVVRFVGSDQEYGCDDTRCSLIQPGDDLTLSCKKVWQYSGTDGWDCNYVRSARKVGA